MSYTFDDALQTLITYGAGPLQIAASLGLLGGDNASQYRFNLYDEGPYADGGSLPKAAEHSYAARNAGYIPASYAAAGYELPTNSNGGYAPQRAIDDMNWANDFADNATVSGYYDRKADIEYAKSQYEKARQERMRTPRGPLDLVRTMAHSLVDDPEQDEYYWNNRAQLLERGRPETADGEGIPSLAALADMARRGADFDASVRNIERMSPFPQPVVPMVQW